MAYQLNPITVSAYAERFMLKVLFEHKGFSKVFYHYDKDVAISLGIPTEIVDERDEKQTEILLRNRWEHIKNLPLPMNWEGTEIAFQNIYFLKNLLDLNQVEVAILQLAFHLKAEQQLAEFSQSLNKMTFTESINFISQVLDLNKKEVTQALNKEGKLTVYSIITKNHFPDRFYEFIEWGEILDFDQFCVATINEEILLSRCVAKETKSTLELSQFSHLKQHLVMLSKYLKMVKNTHKKGANILLYGLPGTGKTEFANLLAKDIGFSTYTLAFTNEEGDPLNGKVRLERCRLAQTLLKARQGLLIFDEIEDIFASSLFDRSVAQSHKAWINQFLEQNDVPMIWISNDVSCMDKAFLRRFDLVLEMPNLPNSHKEKLIKELVGDKLPQSYIQHFSRIEGLSPAVLTRGLNVVASLNEQIEPTQFAEQAMSVFNQTLQAQGYKKIPPLDERKLAYNLDWVSCNADIHKVTEGLKRTKRGRICCYGPPGTGKTAWANWLGQELDMPVLVQQGSDLLSPYVGETEQKIAQAFEQAKENNMVLVFDEVDSFLFVRESGQRSWERSQVNEMLTQIEKFDGLLVVSTNLMNELDPAALRRFDLKLHFDYLNADQVQQFGLAECEKMGLVFNQDTQVQLVKLNNLTPGDFTSVARRHKFSPFDSVNDWVNALVEECKLKQGSQIRKIGF